MIPPDLATLLQGDPFVDYVYSYPHKSSYTALEPAINLAAAWQHEACGRLFGYLHVPFCEMRCGFCNLFTSTAGDEGAYDRYLDGLERQIAAYMEHLPRNHSFAHMAIGGGTPTIFSQRHLERLFSLAVGFGCDPARIPCSCESSPRTLDDEKLGLLKGLGVQRMSIGIQSFTDRETRAINRPQSGRECEIICRRISAQDFPVFNVDLMFGLPEQDERSFLDSIDRAIECGANQLYLYPLYKRPRTFAGDHLIDHADHRRQLYLAGRLHLLNKGWRQCSLRCFDHASLESETAYRCQEDGMVGLGPGARSYTTSLHYSTPYAISRGPTRRIIEDWQERSETEHARITWGIRLNADEQRRRYLILSLLESGLSHTDYRRRFGSDTFEDHPELRELEHHGLAVNDGAHLCLTEAGVLWSDVIGQWLYSPEVRARKASFVPP